MMMMVYVEVIVFVFLEEVFRSVLDRWVDSTGIALFL